MLGWREPISVGDVLMVRGLSKALLFLCALPVAARGETAYVGDLPRPRIVNGVVTADYPSTGVLLVGNPGLMFLTCSATLIGCETVLTAAHCFCSPTDDCQGVDAPDPSEYFVYLQNAGTFGVASISIRSDFAFPVADVAVLELTSPVEGIAPTPLDTAGSSPGTSGTIVGFGRTGGSNNDYGIKRSGAVETAACDNGISNTTSVCWEFTNPLGPPGDDSNTCNGDSGGSLFIDYGSGATLAGVTSGGFSSNCLPDDVSFDANVSFYNAWIQTEGGPDLANTSCGTIPQVGDADTQVLDFEGQVGPSATEETHAFLVGSGVGLLRVTMNGDDAVQNDFDLYVRRGSPPTTSQFDCADATASQFASCEFASPAPGTWYATVRRFSGAGDYQSTVTLFGADCANPANQGEPCDDANACSENDTCQSGACTGTPVANGTPCADDNPCTRPDSCQAGLCVQDASALSGCRTSVKSLLLLRDKGGTRDKLVWKWVRGQETSQSEFADPTAGTDYALCLYAGTTAAVAAAAEIPSDPVLWSPLSDKGYRYNDQVAASDGIKGALLKGSDKDAAKIVVKGKGTALFDPSFPLSLPVKVQLVNLDTDLCWESDFDSGDVLSNDSEQFKAKAK